MRTRERGLILLAVVGALVAGARAGSVDFSIAEKDFPFVDAWLGEFADELSEALVLGRPAAFNMLKEGDPARGGTRKETWKLYRTAAKFYEANADFLDKGRRLDEGGTLKAHGWRVQRMNGLPNLESHPRIHHAVWQSADGRKALFLCNASWAKTDFVWEGHGRKIAERMQPRSFAVVPLWETPAVAKVAGGKTIRGKPQDKGGPRYLSVDWTFGDGVDWSAADRLVIDVVSRDEGGDRLMAYVKDAWTKGSQTDWVLAEFTPGPFGVYRWTVPLTGQETTCVLRKVKQLYIFTGGAEHPHYEIACAQIVRRGAPLPPSLDVPPDVAARRTAWEEERAEARRKALVGLTEVGDLRIGLATTMDKIRPDRPLPFRRPIAEGGAMVKLARGEHEGVQILVGNAGRETLRDVRVEVSDLKLSRAWWRFGAAPALAATNISVGVTGYVRTRGLPRYKVGYNVTTNAAPGYRRLTRRADPGWYPDPILDFLRGADVKPATVQSFWIDVAAPANLPAGEYVGTVRVSCAGPHAASASYPFRVKVWDFTLAKAPPLPLAITFHVGDESPCKAAVNSRLDEWADYLADHFITIDSLYAYETPRFEQLARLKREGRLNMFNLGYWTDFTRSEAARRAWMKDGKPVFDAAYARAKELGLLGHAYIYGMDECPTNRFAAMRETVPLLKRMYPGVPISTTCYDYTYGEDGRLSAIDIFTPDTTKYDFAQAEKARASGRHVWWYLACVPHAPYANFFVECEGIEPRSLMGAQTVKYRPEGFLYYQTSIWRRNSPIESGPYTDWDPFSWGSVGNVYNGDGSWTVVGPGGKPLETMRLYNFRDGLEDYAYAKILFARTGKWPDVPAEVVESVTNFNSSASVHYAWRDRLAEQIERSGK